MAPDNHSHMSRRKVLMTGAGISGGLVAGCLGGGSGDGGTGTTEPDSSGDGSSGGQTTSQSSNDPIVFGYPVPLSGSYGAFGEEQRRAANMYIDEFNQNGGIDGREIEPVYEDTQGDPQTGRQKARKLVEDDGAVVLIGAVSGSVNLSIAEYAVNQNVPQFASAATNAITMQDCERTSFRYAASTQMNTNAGAGWASDNLGQRVWLQTSDYAVGESFINSWTAKAEEIDLEVVGTSKAPLGTTDFSNYITEIQASDAEWVAVGLNGTDLVNFLNQADSYGLRDEMDVFGEAFSFQFNRASAAEALIGAHTLVDYYEGYDSETNREFVNRHVERYDQPPTYFSTLSSVPTNMTKLAIEESGSTDGESLINSLEEITYDAPMYTADFRECDHQSIRGKRIGIIREPDEYDFPDIEIIDEVPPEDVLPACEDTGCSF